jgi:glutamate synthase (ferredoxin)
MNSNQTVPTKQGLYDPQLEHDACGVGFIVQMKGEKSHSIDNPMAQSGVKL